MSNETAINAKLETAQNFARTIAGLVNEHHQAAPYAELAQSLIDLQESGQNGKVHVVMIALQRAILTGTGWKTAINSIEDAVKRRGYQFTSKVDYRTREKPNKTFKLAQSESVKADKKAQAAKEQEEADKIEKDAEIERARLEAEADAKITPADLVASMLKECARLGLSPLDCYTILAGQIEMPSEAVAAPSEAVA